MIPLVKIGESVALEKRDFEVTQLGISETERGITNPSHKRRENVLQLSSNFKCSWKQEEFPCEEKSFLLPCGRKNVVV